LTTLDLSTFTSDLSSTTVTLLDSTAYNSVSPAYKYNSTNQSFPFLIVINEGFKEIGGVHPSIQLNGVVMDVELMVNNKSSEKLVFYSHGSPTSPTPEFSIVGPDLTWGSGQSLNLVIYPYNTQIDLVAGGPDIVGHLLNDSVNRADNDYRFKYQELFSIGLTNAVPGNVTLEVNIPADVTLTHVRIPGPNSGLSKYDKVFLMDGTPGGVELFVAPGRGAVLLDLSAYGFTQGDDIILEFENFGYIKPSEGGALNFNDTNLIDFVGMTHGSSVATTVPFSATATFVDTAGTETTIGDKDYYQFVEAHPDSKSFSYLLVGNYSVTAAVNEIKFTGAGISGNVVNEWEYPFNMSVNISPSTYPYLGTYRSNPLDPLNTTSLPNPAVYFVVPDDLVYYPGSATIVGMSTGVALNETILEYTVDGDPKLVVIRIGTPGGSDIDLGQKFLLNDSIGVQFTVRVNDSFKNQTLQVPAHTISGGSWDPDAVGLRGVWNTKTSRLNETTTIGMADTAITGAGSLNLVPYSTYFGAPELTSPDEAKAKNVKVSARNSTSLDLTHNPLRAVSSNAPEFEANTNGVFTMNLKSKDVDLAPPHNPVPSNATAIFILPNGNFTPVLDLTGISFRLADSNVPPTSDFTLYYTTDSVTPGSVSYSNAMGWTWKTATYINSGPNANNFTLSGMDTFEDITAVKLFVDDYSGSLNLSMPFVVSNLSTPSGWSSSQTNEVIVGQTLYEFENSAPVDKGYTAAIKYVATLAPLLKWDNGAGGLVSITGLTANFDYNSTDNSPLATHPRWNDVVVENDDGYVDLESVVITFTPLGGSSQPIATYSGLGTGTQTNPSTDVYRSSYTLNDAGYTNVSLQAAGTYKITFKTKADIDNRSTTQTYTLNVVKTSGTIRLDVPTALNDAFFMDQDVLDLSDFDDLMWFYPDNDVLGEDSNGGPAFDLYPSDFVLNTTVPSNFFETPGIYYLDYVYSDSFQNKVTITVTLAVKYAGTLTIDAELGGTDLSASVPGLALNVSTDGGTTQTPLTAVGGHYTLRLEADSTAPTAISYEITVNESTLPVGLKVPVLISGIGGSGAGQTANPTETVHFVPIQIEAIILGDSGEVVPGSVVLHDENGNISIAPIISTSPDTYTFKPQSGEWFDDLDHSVLISLNPGYEVVLSSGIESPIPSVLDANTEEFPLNHLDVTYTFTVQKSPLVFGNIWGDLNRNGVNDDGVVIPGATVKVLDSDGVTVLGSTQTDAGGNYTLTRDHGLVDGGDYYIQIMPPAGYNRAEPFDGNDQQIHFDDGYKSDLIEIRGPVSGVDLHHMVRGGFYFQSSNSNGFGSATVVDNGSGNNVPDNGNQSDSGNRSNDGNQSGVGSGNQSGNGNQSGVDSGNHSDTNGSQSGINDETGAGKRFSILGLIVLILSIIIGLVQVFIVGNRRAKKLIDVHRALRIIIAVLMIVVAVIFLLTYDFTGKMILYYWIDLVLAVIFIGQLILIGRIFRAKTQN